MLAVALAAPSSGNADGQPIKIVVVTDMSGVYAALAGRGAVKAAKWRSTTSAEPFWAGGSKSMLSIIVTTRWRRRPRREKRSITAPTWRLTLPIRGAALGRVRRREGKHELAIVTGAASSALTGSACDKYTYLYAYDTYSFAASTGRSIARQSDGKTW